MTARQPRHEAPLPAPANHDTTRSVACERIRNRATYTGRHETRS